CWTTTTCQDNSNRASRRSSSTTTTADTTRAWTTRRRLTSTSGAARPFLNGGKKLSSKDAACITICASYSSALPCGLVSLAPYCLMASQGVKCDTRSNRYLRHAYRCKLVAYFHRQR